MAVGQSDAAYGVAAAPSRDRDADVQAHGVSHVMTGCPLLFGAELCQRCFIHSPRVVLVESYGALAGLITVKDVLRFTMLEQHHVQYSPWSGEDLDGLVDEARTLTSNLADDIVSWGRRVFRRG